jgi:hypothetical protein
MIMMQCCLSQPVLRCISFRLPHVALLQGFALLWLSHFQVKPTHCHDLP